MVNILHFAKKLQLNASIETFGIVSILARLIIRQLALVNEQDYLHHLSCTLHFILHLYTYTYILTNRRLYYI